MTGRVARRSTLLIWALGLGVALAAGCRGRTARRPDVLRVAAASDLQEVLPEIGRRFETLHARKVEFVFGSSGQLAEQIKAGAPFDVFLSANVAFVKELADSGLVRPETVRAYARGELVLAVHEDSGAAIRSFDDLVKPEVKKVAIANPAFAPYGKAAEQALAREGLWDVAANKLVKAESVRQALHYVETGDAEAGLVGRAIAKVPGVRIVAIDPELYEPIVQGLGVVAAEISEDEEAARAFTRFLLGDEGQKMLKDAGFAPPPPSP